MFGLLAIGQLALGIIGFAQQASAAASAADDRKKAAAAEKKKNAIQINTQKIQAATERRQLVREERVRRARMIQGAANTGVAGSSAVGGGISSLGSNFGSVLAQQQTTTKANVGINKQNQIAADFEQRARETLMWSEVFSSGIKLGQSALSPDIWS